MKSQFSTSKFLVLLSVALLSLHCSGGTYVQPPEWSNNVSPNSNYSISGITDFGIAGDGLIHLELQGNFSAFSDSVIASCPTTSNPQATVINDAYNAIDFTMVAIDDTCTFSVQNGTYATNNSISEVVSSTLTELDIYYAYDNGPDAPGNGLDDIVVQGAFNGHNTDQLWAECDGATSFTQAQAAVSSADTKTQLVAAIPTPQNFYSCQFMVSGNNIQGYPYVALEITNATDLSTNTSTGNDTIELDGSFVGPASGLGGDQVWVACDGATFAQVPTANVTSDNDASIQFLIPTPLNFNSCDFYVIGNGFQSTTY